MLLIPKYFNNFSVRSLSLNIYSIIKYINLIINNIEETEVITIYIPNFILYFKLSWK